MTRPVRHHYVPKLLLKQFADENNQIFASRVGSGEAIKVATKNIFVEGHLYTFREADNSPDMYVEDGLSRLESSIGPIVEKLIGAVRNRHDPKLDEQEKAIWDLFFYVQIKRVPSIYTRGTLKGYPEEHVERARKEMIAESPEMEDLIRQVTSGDEGERLIRNAKASHVASSSGMIEGALSKRGLRLFVIPKGVRKQFIIGDTPVVKMGPGGLNDLDHQRWLPIAPDILVGIGDFSRKIMVEAFYDHRLIRHVNMAIRSQCDWIAGADKTLLRSISLGR